VGRLRHAAGIYFTQVGQAFFAPVSTRTFQIGGAALAVCLAGVLEPAGREGLGQLGFRSRAALYRVNTREMPRAAE
jgi:hypothetical protein